MEDEILNKNFDDDSETENYSLNESSDVSTDEECDSILTTVQMSSSNCFIGKNGYKWNKNHAIIGRTRSHNIITHLPGLKGPAKPKPNCGIDIFNLFFTAAIIKQISEFTNAKFEEFRQRISDLTKSTYSNFTSEIEIRAFLGLLYLAGVYKSGHENVESLFASDGTGRDIFRSVMSVKRFLFLLLCIRFDNFKTRCKEDRLSPIRDIFQTIIEKFQSCYTPAEYLTVDEMLVGFRGKCPFKIYMPSKPNKYGIKIVILADSRTHYMYNAMVYTGKSKTPKSKELSLPTQIVLDISRPLWKSNRNITADNWFTSIELVDKLKEHGLTYLGTMRKNKPQIPPQFQPNPKRESGTSIFGFSGTKTLVSYVPKKRKSVILISSMHHDNKCDETTGKPDIIMDYNLTKGGVDTIDQMVSNFSTSRRSRRWPLALFYALLDITALNSYIIFNYQIDKKDQKERSTFIVDLGRSLIDEHLATRSPDPQKTGFIQHCSLVVATEGVPHSLYIEPRDKYGNPCLLESGWDPARDYTVDILEVGSERPVPLPTRWEVTLKPPRIALVFNLPSAGCYRALVSHRGHSLKNGDFHIIVLTKEKSSLVKKNVAKKNHNIWYEARLLSLDGERLSKPKKVFCYISPKQLVVKEFIMKIFPKRITTFRLCPSTKVTCSDSNLHLLRLCVTCHLHLVNRVQDK
ncbi:hypothetical protein LAZ67_23000808 [Cordylochernes scorpioides]|uniref:Transposase n=1 Tax=Cordylochernes scorpioides TaxID=51811 RepID=A0ABY6LV02_9ARAC|nr:hypothetical protein LAZ67_23000808 [Cordylochernes scorpioides]